MTDPDTRELNFSPSQVRYWIVGSFLVVEGLFFLALLTFFASLIANGFYGGAVGGGAFFSIILGAGMVWVCAFLTSYVRNAATVKINFNKNSIRIKTWNSSSNIAISNISKICFLDTLRGWMYIIVYANNESHVVSNLMYFDSDFVSMRSKMTKFLSEIECGQLIYKDTVSQAGLRRNKKLPPFIYAGIWRCALVYAIILILMTFICFLTGFRPASFLRVR